MFKLRKRLVMAALALALVGSACSGSSTSETTTRSAEAPSETVEGDAIRLITELGTDEAAANALIIAMDRGYSGTQILEATVTSKLRADGTITGETPQGQPLRLVLYPADTDEGASGQHPQLAKTEIRLASFHQPDLTPIENIRANASVDRSVGTSQTEAILILLREGLRPEHIVEALILGIDETLLGTLNRDVLVMPPNTNFCVRVTDELYCDDGQRHPAATPDQDDSDLREGSATDEIGADPSQESDSTVGIDAVYSGQANAAAIADVTTASYEWRAVSFEAQVNGDMVELTVTTSLFIWWRGGDRDGEYTGDQNCGGLIVETLTGSGRAGSPTEIELFANSSELAEQRGALCEGDEPDRNLHQVGERVGTFVGQANGLGFDGVFASSPAVFVTIEIPLASG